MAKTSTTKAVKGAIAKAKSTGGEVDSSVSNYERHPFFIKKANEARELIKRAGLPRELRKKDQ